MNPSPNLFLIGPMGSGKSSIGRRLARHFGLPFVDLDACVEEHAGTSIATMFDIEGEAGFRLRESRALAEATAQQPIVLATGGGAVLEPANRVLLRQRGFVVWLEASVAQQLARLAHDRRRPLLAAADRTTRLQDLASRRNPIYRELADLAVASGDEPCRVAAERIARLLEIHWQRVASTGARA